MRPCSLWRKLPTPCDTRGHRLTLVGLSYAVFQVYCSWHEQGGVVGLYMFRSSQRRHLRCSYDVMNIASHCKTHAAAQSRLVQIGSVRTITH